jgi:hypothetical protein
VEARAKALEAVDFWWKRKRKHLIDRNFPCLTLKIRNVSLVVMGS